MNPHSLHHATRFDLLNLQIQMVGLIEAARKKDDPQTPAPKGDRRHGSNINPEGAAGAGGAAPTVPANIEKTLGDQVATHNERHDEPEKQTTLAILKKVYQRGVGAYSTSHRPSVTSREQWGLGRVRAFLELLRNGKPKNSNYIGDNDLLPKGHPRSPKSA